MFLYSGDLVDAFKPPENDGTSNKRKAYVLFILGNILIIGMMPTLYLSVWLWIEGYIQTSIEGMTIFTAITLVLGSIFHKLSSYYNEK